MDKKATCGNFPSMRIFVAACLLVFSGTLAQGTGIRVATYNVGAAFDASDGFVFTHGIGPKGGPDHDLVAAVLARIDADVVALQELHTGDLSQHLPDLAATLGYPHVYVSSLTRAFDTTLRVAFLSRYPFLSQTSIAAPVGTREITRNHPAVVVNVPGTNRNPLIISAHLKAGTTQADRFRRAVEMRRLTDFLNAPAQSAINNWVILGDFNPSSISTDFPNLPANLPATFNLGNDIQLPISYHVNPLLYFSARIPFLLDPRQLDGSPSTFNTSSAGGPTLDLIMISPALAAGPVLPEIYNSNFDLSNDSGLPKSGNPPGASTSAAASDHYAVFADITLETPSRYTFSSPGEIIREDFTGFLGVMPPARWTTGGGEWLGRDDGTSSETGFRSYKDGVHGGALGYLQGDDEGTATAAFTNGSERPLTALEISLSTEIRRAVEAGSADGFEVDLLLDGDEIPLPELVFTAGDEGGLQARARGLHIAPGEDFGLRFRFLRANAPPLPSDVFINEFHYDNTGTDVGEFVEVVVGPGYAGSLADVVVYPYNGSNGQVYGPVQHLGQFNPGAITPSGHRFFSADFNGLQNDHEGLALVAGGQVLHFISYEGTVTATNGPAAGMTSVNIGVAQTSSEPVGHNSLGLTGSGGIAGEFSWTKFSGLPHSPGQPNAGQTFTNLPPAQGISIDDLEVTFLPDNDLDGIPDDEDPDDDNDGISDADEEIFGTDPFDPNSHYTIRFTRPDANTVRLTFPTYPGRIYTVQTSGDLNVWTDTTGIPGDGLERSMDFPVDPHGGPRFYRVRAELE